MAVSGSMKRPPSEKESGVTLSTPMTAGRAPVVARANAARCQGWRSFGARASWAPLCAAHACGVKRSTLARSVGDLLRKPSRVLDPPRDQLLGGEEAHELAPLVGLGHG